MRCFVTGATSVSVQNPLWVQETSKRKAAFLAGAIFEFGNVFEEKKDESFAVCV